jgi:hypothetical protein
LINAIEINVIIQPAVSQFKAIGLGVVDIFIHIPIAITAIVRTISPFDSFVTASNNPDITGIAAGDAVAAAIATHGRHAILKAIQRKINSFVHSDIPCVSMTFF